MRIAERETEFLSPCSAQGRGENTREVGEFSREVEKAAFEIPQKTNEAGYLSQNEPVLSGFDENFPEQLEAFVKQNRAHFRREKDDLKMPTREELAAVAKARARKKARLDAYFRRLERTCIKRKIVETENAKRKKGKVYCFSTFLECLADSRLLVPPPEHKV